MSKWKAYLDILRRADVMEPYRRFLSKMEDAAISLDMDRADMFISDIVTAALEYADVMAGLLEKWVVGTITYEEYSRAVDEVYGDLQVQISKLASRLEKKLFTFPKLL